MTKKSSPQAKTLRRRYGAAGYKDTVRNITTEVLVGLMCGFVLEPVAQLIVRVCWKLRASWAVDAPRVAMPEEMRQYKNRGLGLNG